MNGQPNPQTKRIQKSLFNQARFTFRSLSGVLSTFCSLPLHFIYFVNVSHLHVTDQLPKISGEDLNIVLVILNMAGACVIDHVVFGERPPHWGPLCWAVFEAGSWTQTFGAFKDFLCGRRYLYRAALVGPEWRWRGDYDTFRRCVKVFVITVKHLVLLSPFVFFLYVIPHCTASLIWRVIIRWHCGYIGIEKLYLLMRNFTLACTLSKSSCSRPTCIDNDHCVDMGSPTVIDLMMTQ